jgi:hypothetical protein
MGIETRQAVIALADGQNRVYVVPGGVRFQAQETQNVRHVYKCPVMWLHLTHIAILWERWRKPPRTYWKLYPSMPTSLLYAVICASWGDWGAAVAAAKTAKNTRSCEGKSKNYLLYRVAMPLLPDRADGSEKVSFTTFSSKNKHFWKGICKLNVENIK